MADTLTPMHVEIISPDGAIYKKDGVDMVIARALDGDFAVMKNHVPIAAALQVCTLRIQFGDEEERMAVFGGFLDMKDNKVHILAPLAELADDIDVARAQAAKKKSRRKIGCQKSGFGCRTCQSGIETCFGSTRYKRSEILKDRKSKRPPDNKRAVFFEYKEIREII